MLTAETQLEATIWLCFRGIWGQWRSDPSLSQLVEMGGLGLAGRAVVSPGLTKGLAQVGSCRWVVLHRLQRRKRLVLLRKEEMESKLGQVLWIFTCDLCSPGVSVVAGWKGKGEFTADWRVGAQILGDHWSQGQEKWWTKPALPFSVFTSCIALCEKVQNPEMTCWCQTVFLHLITNNNYWPQISAPAADNAFLLPGWACCCCRLHPMTGAGGSLIWSLNWLRKHLQQFLLSAVLCNQSLLGSELDMWDLQNNLISTVHALKEFGGHP